MGEWEFSLVVGGLGLLLLVLSLRARSLWGLSLGETAALDNVTLFSRRHRLTGRPDRIVKHGRFFIPEEWKSSKKVEPWHVAQLAVYFILIEEHYGEAEREGANAALAKAKNEFEEERVERARAEAAPSTVTRLRSASAPRPNSRSNGP